MMEWVGKLIDWIKLSPKYLFPVVLASGFIIFARAEWIQPLGLTELRTKYLPWISITFLVSATLVASHAILAGCSWVKWRFSMRKKLKQAKQRLHNLTPEEQEILRFYIGNQTKTQQLDIQSGVVNGLSNELIIYRASNVGVLQEWAYNIQPWVWDYLNKYPELIFSEEEIELLQQR